MRDEIKYRAGAIIPVLIIWGMFIGCSTTPAPQKMGNPVQAEIAPSEPADYLLHPDDELEIKFFYNPELNEKVIVRPDGKISLQLVDEVTVAGLSPAQVDDLLTKKYAGELKKPDITIFVRSFSGRRVYVGGEVEKPGILPLTATMTPLQAVIHAGGFTENAKPEAAILIRKGPDRKPVPISINLDDMIEGRWAEAAFLLRGDDILFVPKTAIAKANKFVYQYIERLLLFRGVSFGFAYEVHSDDSE